MYHSISNDKNRFSVKIDDFYKQMKTMINFGYKSVNLNEILNNSNKKKFVITFDDGYEDVFINALPILNELKLKATCFIVSNQIGKKNSWDDDKEEFPEMNLMNEKQILSWHQNGLEIGSHSLDHANLKKLSLDEKKKQIIEPKRFFKMKFNINISSFSYPFGGYDETCFKLIKENYNFAVTTKRSRFDISKFGMHEIPRVPINFNTSIYKFLIKILTVYEDIKHKN